MNKKDAKINSIARSRFRGVRMKTFQHLLNVKVIACKVKLFGFIAFDSLQTKELSLELEKQLKRKMKNMLFMLLLLNNIFHFY